MTPGPGCILLAIYKALGILLAILYGAGYILLAIGPGCWTHVVYSVAGYMALGTYILLAIWPRGYILLAIWPWVYCWLLALDVGHMWCTV